MKPIREVIIPFYREALTVKSGVNPSEILNELLADDFVSRGSVENKNKQALIAQIGFFWKLVPDLKWTPQDLIVEGDKAVVRSEVTGTPSGNFMGVPTTGAKSFRFMTIDIHQVKEGRIHTVYHLEDWVTAIGQVKA